MVCVVGLGYVGLPLAVTFAEAGFKVVGVDTNAAKVAAVNAGRSHVPDVPSEKVARLALGAQDERGVSGPTASSALGEGRLSATTGYDAVREADAVLICVPTPLGKTRDPDVSHIVAAANEIAPRLREGALVVLESTTYPGSTEELVLPRLVDGSAGRLQVGRDFFLAFSPERVDPGREDWTITTTPKVIGGVTEACTQVASWLYGAAIDEVVAVSSSRAAEMVKLLENTFRAANIALANEMAIMCDHLGLDVWEVIEAAATKPFGFMPFYPGPGLGGHCIPVDPHYLVWKMRALGYTARFIQLADEINSGMPQHVALAITKALGSESKPLNGASVLLLGVAYKPDVADTRESPALDLMHLLRQQGAVVSYHDPLAPSISEAGLEMASVGTEGEPTLVEALEAADCVVVVTDHSGYDWGGGGGAKPAGGGYPERGGAGRREGRQGVQAVREVSLVLGSRLPWNDGKVEGKVVAARSRGRHSERSAAAQLSFRAQRGHPSCHSERSAAIPFVIPSAAQRSRGI